MNNGHLLIVLMFFTDFEQVFVGCVIKIKLNRLPKTKVKCLYYHLSAAIKWDMKLPDLKTTF